MNTISSEQGFKVSCWTFQAKEGIKWLLYLPILFVQDSYPSNLLLISMRNTEFALSHSTVSSDSHLIPDPPVALNYFVN